MNIPAISSRPAPAPFPARRPLPPSVFFLFAALPVIFLTGCAPAEAPVTEPPGAEEPGQGEASLLVPPGYGTLLQDNISLRLQSGDLLLKVTPLEEWVIRLTAPDTYERLRGLASSHGPRASRGSVTGAASLFLVSLFSYQPDVTYQPEDLLLVNRGLRFRPLLVRPYRIAGNKAEALGIQVVVA